MRVSVSDPEFNQLPNWAHWLAQDADGTWWAFEHEPNLADSAWYENEVGRSLRLGAGTVSDDWKGSLIKIV
jgi:hypothetical protein